MFAYKIIVNGHNVPFRKGVDMTIDRMIALMDAVSSINKTVIEVHFSDISKREDFRKRSYLTPVCEKTFKGEGIKSYYKAINYLIEK